MIELFRLEIPMVSCSLHEIPILKESDFPIIVETISNFKDNRRRDPDNYICANKLICDSLVEIGVMPDDSYKYISQHRCSIGGQKVAEPYTELIIYADTFKLT